MKALMLLWFFIISPIAYSNEIYTGNKLKRDLDAWITNTDPRSQWTSQAELFNAGVGYGYVTGMSDALNKVVVCFSDQVTRGQVVAVVAKYLNENPEILDKPAGHLVIIALTRAFPSCQSTSKDE